MQFFLLPSLLFVVAIAFLIRNQYRRAVVCGFAALAVIAVVIPGPVLPTSAAKRNGCIWNLRLLDEAKKGWATANSVTNRAVPLLSDLAGKDNRLRLMPQCPEGGTYTIGTLNEKPTCSLAERGHKLE
jgi:hypothetical protein